MSKVHITLIITIGVILLVVGIISHESNDQDSTYFQCYKKLDVDYVYRSVETVRIRHNALQQCVDDAKCVMTNNDYVELQVAKTILDKCDITGNSNQESLNE